MLLVYLATFAVRERSELRAAEGTAGGSGSVPLWKLRAWLQHFDTRDLRSPTFRTQNDESVMNSARDNANRTPRGNDESVRNGGTTPFIAEAGSEINSASSLENSPAAEVGNSLEQVVEGTPTSVEMATPTTASQLH